MELTLSPTLVKNLDELIMTYVRINKAVTLTFVSENEQRKSYYIEHEKLGVHIYFDLVEDVASNFEIRDGREDIINRFDLDKKTSMDFIKSMLDEVELYFTLKVVKRNQAVKKSIKGIKKYLRRKNGWIGSSLK